MRRHKYISLFMFFFITILLFTGCGQKASYTVEFNNGKSGTAVLDNMTVLSGDKIEEPSNLESEGYSFLGWYKNPERTEKWDFGKDKVKSDITLFGLWDKNTDDSIQESSSDKDFTSIQTPGSQEKAYEYQTYFLPEVDGLEQPFVGDAMPYYEDGTYYIYYLKDGGDSYNHSIYLVTTQDFVNYTEHDTPILESSRSGGQDSWIGTGSVVKVDDIYYLFYTGHTSDPNAEFKETIMVAKGNNLYDFEKVEGWEIKPPADLNQKNDFRDPQAYYYPDENNIVLTVTAAKGGVARILKHTVAADLSTHQYDGVIFTNEEGDFWNLECSDTFKIGETWYLTYSAQDDTLWYASAEEPYGPYSKAKRLEGKLFYAPKHVEDENESYMVGWARRSESPSSTQDVLAWGGNLVAQRITQTDSGELVLEPIPQVEEQFNIRRELELDHTHLHASSGALYSYFDVFHCYESFLISGEFTFSGEGSFGLSFDYNGDSSKNKMISINPTDNVVQLLFNEGSTHITEKEVSLEANKTYSFTYIQEGSVGVFYIDDLIAMTVRIYGASGKTIQLFTENNTVDFSSLRQYTK